MSKSSTNYLEIQQEIINSNNKNYDPDCEYCVSHYRERISPPHYASKTCQSGGWNHCTCDTCF